MNETPTRHVLLKAQVKGAGGADLFASKVKVGGYTTGHGSYVAPHEATRMKHQGEVPKAPGKAKAAAGPKIEKHERFVDASRPGDEKTRFTFTAMGTEQTGTIYVTSTLSGDRDADIAKAAKIAAKRAGADKVTIYAIGYY